MRHEAQWQTASPVWDRALDDGGAARFAQPLLLRYAGDDFMDRFGATLAAEPGRLAEFAARHETWQTPEFEQAGWQTAAEQAAGPAPKLYQPAHNRFYLVAANLVCRQRGLPDRATDAAQGERTGFVVRRLFAKPGQTLDPANPASYDEHGWFGDRQRGVWLRIAQPELEAPAGEERLPLFPTAFAQGGRNRRLLAGMIPAASREVYEGGERGEGLAATASEPGADPRFARFSAEVGAGLVDLTKLPAVSNEAARERLIFLLISFGDWLAEELPAVWSDLNGGPAATGPAAAVSARLRAAGPPPAGAPDHRFGGRTWAQWLVSAASNSLRAALLGGQAGFVLPPVWATLTRANIVAGAASLNASALRTEIAAALGDPRAAAFAELIEARLDPLTSLPESWGDAATREALLAALGEVDDFLRRELPAVWSAVVAGSPSGLTGAASTLYSFLGGRAISGISARAALAETEANRARLEAGDFGRVWSIVRSGATKADVAGFATALLAGGLFRTRVEAALAAAPLTPAPPPAGPTPETHYVIRCVYDRPRCPASVPLVGRASRPFRLASFFDPDAPVRPIKVRMPVDTTVEGLAKFPKGVQFLLSDQLRKQMARAEALGMQGLIDGGDSEPPSLDLGVICSFSIPIITICALILLMIVVQLLNIVFQWLPLFRVCLPLPLKAK